MDVLMDYINELNWVAVLAATLAAFVVGAVWYSNALFAKPWMKGAKITEKDMKNADMVKPMVVGLLVTFASAVALAVVYDVLALEGAIDGALLGVLVAAGFIATNKIMHNMFEMKPTDYTVITVSGDLVSLAVMGAVLGLLA
jgi:hypothetical protein